MDQMTRIAPNLNFFLWRPVLSDPPIYTQRDLHSWVILRDVFDANEALDLIAAREEKSREEYDK